MISCGIVSFSLYCCHNMHMERDNTRFVNCLRYFALSYGGWQCAAWVCLLFVPDSRYLATNIELVLFPIGVVVPPLWVALRDRGWRMKSPFYRVSDDLDLAPRVERLEQRVSSFS